MSGDLISRQTLLQEITGEENQRADRLMSTWYADMVSRQPAALDVDKVVEQIEKNKRDAIKHIEENSKSEFAMIKIMDLKELFEEYTREQIEIIKSALNQ